MNNKGFTLIELTAIIVVLAAIFLVCFPNLLNISREDEEKKYDNMVDNLCLAGESYIYSNIDSFPELSTPNSLIKLNISTLIEYGNVKKNTTNPNTNKIVDNNFLEYTVLSDNSLSCEYVDTACLMTKDDNNNGLLNIGDIVTCGTESFYVVPDHEKASENTVSLLAKHNLNIGDHKYPNESTYGIQEEKAVGWLDHGYQKYGDIMYASENYWLEESALKSEYGTSFPVWVYDNNSLIYEHIENYKNYLISSGVDNLLAFPPSYKQVKKLGCEEVKANSCVSGGAKTWVYSSCYWLGTALFEEDNEFQKFRLYAIGSYELHEVGTLDSIGIVGVEELGYGVRPVIILPVNDYLKRGSDLQLE
ncbi:MAG: type II secretion system protein [Bacilli bacterium]|nr:type II secretion system protein [Bacilli bacterium]